MRRNPNMLLRGCSLYWFHQRDGLAMFQGQGSRPDCCGRAVNQQRQSFLRWHSENRVCMQKMCLLSFLLPLWFFCSYYIECFKNCVSCVSNQVFFCQKSRSSDSVKWNSVLWMFTKLFEALKATFQVFVMWTLAVLQGEIYFFFCFDSYFECHVSTGRSKYQVKRISFA